MAKKEKVDYEALLIREYEHWEYLKEHGGSDPNYDDGVNMNLTRNHIIYYKNELEDLYGEDMSKYPEVYFRELPPEVEGQYVARADKIRDKAGEVLEIYLADANFQYLLCNRELLNKKEADNTCINYVLGYVSGLAGALKSDDLLTMRRHAFRPESYQESFASCAEKVKQILFKKRTEQPETIENGQMTLFQIRLDVGQCR